MEQNDAMVPALEKALDVLEYLIHVDRPPSLKEISDTLKISKSSAHRIMKTLVKRNYVTELHTNLITYSIGPQIPQLFLRYNSRFSIASVAKPVMMNLSFTTSQTSQLAIMNNFQFVYVEQVSPPVPVSIIAPLHVSIAVNHSAGARIILANTPTEFQVKYLESTILEKRTKHTIVDRVQLLEELQRCKHRGYAFDNEEFALGIGCVAAAIFDCGGNCIGAVGTTGHIDAYSQSTSFDNIVHDVQQAAQEISAKFGYSGRKNLLLDY